ncbi:hypothetical protein ROZALSC1DRAFT_25400, partial [Rozella allomycis CSF55]
RDIEYGLSPIHELISIFDILKYQTLQRHLFHLHLKLKMLNKQRDEEQSFHHQNEREKIAKSAKGEIAYMLCFCGGDDFGPLESGDKFPKKTSATEHHETGPKDEGSTSSKSPRSRTLKPQKIRKHGWGSNHAPRNIL